jgi:hypothetical protein
MWEQATRLRCHPACHFYETDEARETPAPGLSERRNLSAFKAEVFLDKEDGYGDQSQEECVRPGFRDQGVGKTPDCASKYSHWCGNVAWYFEPGARCSVGSSICLRKGVDDEQIIFICLDGQSKNVTIYRLITRRSFEASMFERASKKLGLEQAVLGSRQFADIDGEEGAAGKQSAKMDAKEMEQLLKEGAYSVLLEDNSEEIKEFFDQDIEKLLQQRAHVMVAETCTATESWLNKKNMSVKTRKSLFTGDMAMEHAEIDVNDPDFWKKVLPDLVTPDSMLERLALADENFGQDEEEEGESNNHDTMEKFMKDLTQMIEGMLDFN